MRFLERENLIDQVAQRMNPGKYSWSDTDKKEMLEAADSLLSFLDGYSSALDAAAQEEKRRKEVPESYLAAADNIQASGNAQ